MSIDHGALDRLQLSTPEIEYLRSFLTAGDRKGFYISKY